MQTSCHERSAQTTLDLGNVGRRRVAVDFSGGHVSSDGGLLLLRQVDQRIGLSERMAQCFTDHRNPDLVEHEMADLIAQRVFGLALGYEDLNDHEQLGHDPLWATAVGKTDPEGKDRRHEKDRGKALASPSTLGRVERTKANATAQHRYEKTVCDLQALQTLFVQLFIESQSEVPESLVLDIDPTDIELHGQQEQRFYHGYYGHHCYLPMHVFCGDFPLAVKLRPSNIDGPSGVVELVAPIVTQLRARWPELKLLIRADSAFCRDYFMTWCEQNDVDYVLGMAKNSRLSAAIATQMEKARREHLQTGKAARRFRSFTYRTRDSWSRKRRVVGKAEYLDKGPNARFVVTSLSAAELEKRVVYEELYCARGEMENRIKEQLSLFADRASCHTFRGNQMRLWWSMAAHVLVVSLRRLALQDTVLHNAQAPTLRNRLFKIGAVVTVSVRRVYVRLCSAFPLREIFALAAQRLQLPEPAS